MPEIDKMKVVLVLLLHDLLSNDVQVVCTIEELLEHLRLLVRHFISSVVRSTQCHQHCNWRVECPLTYLLTRLHAVLCSRTQNTTDGELQKINTVIIETVTG